MELIQCRIVKKGMVVKKNGKNIKDVLKKLKRKVLQKVHMQYVEYLYTGENNMAKKEKWGKIGAQKSKKRKEWLEKLRKKRKWYYETDKKC